MAFKYPYGNLQALNLDWLLKQWVEFKAAMENIIAPQYSNTTQYDAGSLVIYQDKLYYNAEAIMVPGDFNAELWTETTVSEILIELRDIVTNL